MRKRCKNNYIEAFGAVYWGKKPLLKKKILWLQQPPFRGLGLTIVQDTCLYLIYINCNLGFKKRRIFGFVCYT